MNGKYLLAALAGTMILFSACQREADPTDVPEGNVTFTALTSQLDSGVPGTRTYLDNLMIKWEKNEDWLKVFNESGQDALFWINELYNADTRAIFNGNIGGSHCLALYPHSSAATANVANGTINTTLPVVQVIPSGMNVAHGAMLSVAEVDDIVSNSAKEITMTNVFGVVQVKISRSDIASVTLEGNTDTALAGDVTITVGETPTIVPVAGHASSSVTIKPSGDGATFAPGTYYIVAIPTALEGGFRVIYKRNDGQYGARSWSDTDYAIVRNSGLNLGNAEPSKWRNGLVAQLVAGSATSSTLTFEWSESNFTDAAADNARDYRFALYRDAGCTDLVVAWNTPKGNSYTHGESTVNIFYNVTPRFTFTGLDANTDYWFKVYDNGYKIDSEAIQAKTADFTPVTIPATVAAAGVVILAEDFSELTLGGDMSRRAAGHCNENYSNTETYTAYTIAAGNLQYNSSETQDEYMVSMTSEYGITKVMKTASANSRLANWAGARPSGSSDGIYSRPGYVKLGTSDVNCQLYTPILSCIPAGYTATVQVTFKAMDYLSAGGNADGSTAQVGVANGGTLSADTPMLFPKATRPTIADNQVFALSSSWQEYTYTLTGVTNESRIQIGTTASKKRMYVDDVVISIVSFQPDGAPLPSVSWLFNESTIEANTATWSGQRGYTAGTGGLYLNSDASSSVSGTGVITYVQPDRSAFSEISIYNSIGSTGQPMAHSPFKDDYWLFTLNSMYELPAGTQLHIKFDTRSSTYGLKYWTAEYYDGSNWQAASELIAGDGFSYNTVMVTGSGNTRTECTWTLATACSAPMFRLVCAANIKQGDAVINEPNGSTARIATNKIQPIFEVTSVPE